MWNESPCLLSTEVKRVGHMVFRFLLWVVHVYISYGEHTKHVHGSAFVDVIRRQRVHFLFLARHHESKKTRAPARKAQMNHMCAHRTAAKASARNRRGRWGGTEYTQRHTHIYEWINIFKCIQIDRA